MPYQDRGHFDILKYFFIFGLKVTHTWIPPVVINYEFFTDSMFWVSIVSTILILFSISIIIIESIRVRKNKKNAAVYLRIFGFLLICSTFAYMIIVELYYLTFGGQFVEPKNILIDFWWTLCSTWECTTIGLGVLGPIIGGFLATLTGAISNRN